MNPAALFLSGWLAGVLTVVFLAIIGLRPDRSDDLRDNGSNPLFIGGGADNFQTHGERN